jgi:hypothetical protein
MMRIRHKSIGVALALVCLFGCRAKVVTRADRATVSGKVTLAEQPLTGGSISFISTNDAGQRATGILLADGTFAIADVPIGPVRVAVDTEPMRVGAPDRYVKIPAKYANPDTSGFTYEVKPGDNTGASFNLE